MFFKIFYNIIIHQFLLRILEAPSLVSCCLDDAVFSTCIPTVCSVIYFHLHTIHQILFKGLQAPQLVSRCLDSSIFSTTRPNINNIIFIHHNFILSPYTPPCPPTVLMPGLSEGVLIYHTHMGFRTWLTDIIQDPNTTHDCYTVNLEATKDTYSTYTSIQLGGTYYIIISTYIQY